MSRILISSFFGLLLSMLSLSCFSQQTNPLFISLNYRTGENKPHREIIKNLYYPYRGVDLKIGWQTTGSKDWQRAYRYPSLGVGVNWNTFKTDILGAPVGVYFFSQFPQFHTSWCRLDLEVNFGLSYGINPYNEVTNPTNFSTGTSLNSIFGLFLEQSFHITPQADLFVSGGLGHYSNGALGWPNLGLNIPMLKFGVRYLTEKTVFEKSKEKFDFKKALTINTFIGGGIKTLFAPTPVYREVVISPTLFYRTGFKRRLGLGFEMAYNEAKAPVLDYSFEQLLTYGVHLSHEFIIDRFTILGQFGIYLKNQPSDKFYFERIGFGYYLTKHTRIVLNVKAHYIKAEYMEAGIVFDLDMN
jgi:hypothetical protein